MSRTRRYLPHVKVKHTNYFRLIAEEDGTKFYMTIGANVSTSIFLWIEYSVDDGETWTRVYNIDNEKVTINMPTIQTNQSIIMRGNGKSMGCYYTSSAYYTQIKNNSKKFSVCGIIMTLLKGAWADRTTELDPDTDYSFRTLFENTRVTHAHQLIMPPNAVKDCFNSMFKGCPYLVSAPLLQALILYQGSYKNMFNGCTSLNYIKMLAIDITEQSVPNPGERALANWVTNVSEHGTFDKNRNATWNVTGVSGVPTNWTVRYVDP